MLAGPVLGTFVYRQFGIELAILWTGASFLLSALAMLFLPADRQQVSDKTQDQTSLLHEMAEGIRYVFLKLLWLNLCFTCVGLGAGLIALQRWLRTVSSWRDWSSMAAVS
jgi:hypothetical protein